MPWLAGGGVQELERRSSARRSRLPAEACLVRTPLRVNAWQEMLADHPDRRLVEWVVRGIQQGFRVGYQCDLRQARQNLSSVRQHPEVVRGYLDKEREAGRVITVGRVEQAEALGFIAAPSG